MVHLSVIEARVSHLGIRLTRWFRPELRELQHILMNHEKIVALVPGRYFGGYALLVATDQRLLLIDKKTFFMNIEDIRYDMISEIDYSSRLLESTLLLFTVNKQHRFTTVKYKQQLRALTNYLQQRVMELRHYGQPSVSEPSAPEPSYAPQPILKREIHIPRPHLPTRSPPLPKIMGAAAIKQTHNRININPYARGSLVTKSQWSTNSPQPEY